MAEADKNDELMKRLLTEDDLFRKRYDTHKDYEKQIELMDKKAHLDADEVMEQKKLKKLKLALKDEMEQIISSQTG
jgi:hypothetical protein